MFPDSDPVLLIRLLWLAALLAFLLPAGCGEVRSPRLQASADQPPEWIVRVPAADDTFLYFRGIRTGVARLEDGERDAMQAAVRSILDYLGQEGMVYYAAERHAAATRITDRVRLQSAGTVHSAKLVQLYYRQVVSQEGRFLYDVFTLVRYPRREVVAERERYLAERKRLFQAALRSWCQGRAAADKGHDDKALADFALVRDLLARIPRGVYLDLLAKTGTEDFARQAESRRRIVEKKVRSLVVVVSAPDGVRRDVSSLFSPLVVVLEKFGFSLQGPVSRGRGSLPESRYRLEITVGTTEPRDNLGQFYSSLAEGDLRMRDLRHDQLVFSRALQSRGFAENADAARYEALTAFVARCVDEISTVYGTSHGVETL
ncbi:hypothetical protein C2E25_16525 [Geothermobacter hydrogeniphilus]|uniref:Uncharacterized protein n=1 Tax=Geothermobacter hydrogeniphilus TaxID=1969733 RepID=A0A2K2H614_9BACT|nr:hypothetical protein [Geothermobacter hydrogeniphilus]PNU18653.1 hypothetical protein C2E25_16525 [Geothermobacter hydrogeniphilus]